VIAHDRVNDRDSRVIRSSTRVVAGAFALAMTTLGCPPDKPACDAKVAAPPPAQRLCDPHSVVLVRHAEKAAPVDPHDKDPDLSPKGQERAARLATLLGKTAVSRLVATEYKRTQHTLAPLSARIGKPVEVRSAAHTNDLVRELRDAPPGSTTVVASHSNVIPMIVRELGGGALRDLGPDGTLPENDHSRVLVMTVGCSATAPVVELSSD
jgi:phosphohistidine phosphatase SixA